MRGRSVAVWSLCAVSCVGFTSVASAASHPQARHGFWIGLGAGVGSASATCDGCDGHDRQTGVDGYLKLGGTLSERLLLGAEFNGWGKEQEGVTLNLFNATGTLTFYPQASAGFFVKGGVGVSFLETDVVEGSTVNSLDLGTGLGLLAGIGHDVRVGKNISVTPALNFWYGRTGGVSFLGDTPFTNWKHNVVDFSVGITFH